MSLAAIMATTAQQSAPVPHQTQPPAKRPAKTYLGSISPKTATAKVKVTAVKRVRKCKRVAGSKKPRKSRVVYNFTAETLSQYFHLSQRDAAKLLGIAPITMKRNCKRQGIMWPYRAQKIEAAHRARQGSESASSENEEDGDGYDDGKDTSDEEEDATTAAETQAAQALVSMSPAVHAPLVSEAGLVFARLPYLCLEENAVEEERDLPSCVV